MVHWQKYKLSDLADITSSKRIFTADYVSQGILFYRSKEIIEKSLGQTISDPLFITQDRFKEIKIKFGTPQKGDILLSAVGERAGVSYVVRNEPEFYFKDGNLIWLRKLSDKLNPFYLHYWVLSEIGQDILNSIMIGSAQKALTIIGLKNLELNLPSILTQSRIASILSSLDNKIELNRRMNQTLEQMAQALFNHYFVDNIDPDNLPEGWRSGKLGEILELKYGKALKEKQRKKGIYAVVGSGGIIGYHDEFILGDKGVVVGRKGNSGAVTWLHEAFYPIDTTFYVSDLLGINGLYYYYFLLKSLNLKNLNSDSAVPGLNRNEAHHQEILILENKKINAFNNIVASFFNKININLKEIKTLTTIRDTLLPKLMSGEIDFDEINNREDMVKEYEAVETIEHHKRIKQK